MDLNVYDKCFDIINPGACLTRLIVCIQAGIITKCVLHGTCEGNLRLLSLNLTGEKLTDAVRCIDDCCGDKSQKCIKDLQCLLTKLFIDFEMEYTK